MQHRINMTCIFQGMTDCIDMCNYYNNIINTLKFNYQFNNSFVLKHAENILIIFTYCIIDVKTNVCA